MKGRMLIPFFDYIDWECGQSVTWSDVRWQPGNSRKSRYAFSIWTHEMEREEVAENEHQAREEGDYWDEGIVILNVVELKPHHIEQAAQRFLASVPEVNYRNGIAVFLWRLPQCWYNQCQC